MSYAYYNDNEPFPCRVIESNIERGRLPAGRVHCEDIRQVEASDLAGYSQIHLFAGIGGAAYACRLAGLPDNFSIATFGFPCQNISATGDGSGLDGTRSGLFFEATRILRGLGEGRPTWLLVENSPLLRTRGLARVINGLEEAGYTILDPLVMGADNIGAPHRRKRTWIVGHSNHAGLQRFLRNDGPATRRQGASRYAPETGFFHSQERPPTRVGGASAHGI